MKRSKKILIPTFTVLTIISLSTTVNAAWVRLNGSSVSQAKSNWCWAASAENAIRWEMTPTRTQWDAVGHIKGYSFPDVTGSLADTEKAAEYISNGTKDYTYVNEIRDFYWLRRELVTYSNYILLSAGYYDGDIRVGGHMVCMTGAEYDTQWIQYLDPADNTRYECSYQSFWNGYFNGRKYDRTVYNTGY